MVFDVGHGGGSFDYTVAEAAIAQGAGPDTISSDIHVFSRQLAGHALPHVGDEQVPEHGLLARAGGRDGDGDPGASVDQQASPKLGTLQVGAPGDVSMLEVVEGPVEFVDTRNNKREGKVHIKPAGAVVAGVAYRSPVPGAVCRAVIPSGGEQGFERDLLRPTGRLQGCEPQAATSAGVAQAADSCASFGAYDPAGI